VLHPGRVDGAIGRVRKTPQVLAGPGDEALTEAALLCSSLALERAESALTIGDDLRRVAAGARTSAT
jgi:hypothetical protein